MDDWPVVKARLDRVSADDGCCALCGASADDIRAALQRVEELESQRWYSAETRERELLKRVEGLEREVEKMEPWGRGLTARAEAAEAKLAKVVEALEAMVIVMESGQPCYRTGNGIPQEMPRKVERVVRAALAALRGGE